MEADIEIEGSCVLVTGAKGFLGKHLVRALEKENPGEIITFTSQQYDLRQVKHCQKLFGRTKKIDLVFHLACKVGGINFNINNPATIICNNLLMNTLVLHYAWKYGVNKFLGAGSVCEYPKFPAIPFRESELWEGYPEESNGVYGVAKRALLATSQAYRDQYGFNAIHPLIINLYGPGDNFDIGSGHVIPGMIRKMVDAKERQNQEVTLWGSGSNSREFLYVEDAAEALVLMAKYYSKPEPINIGSGQEISIRDLAKLIADLTGFEGKIIWDQSKPEGQQRRLLDVSRAKREFGFEAKTSLREGIDKTIKYYEEARTKR